LSSVHSAGLSLGLPKWGDEVVGVKDLGAVGVQGVVVGDESGVSGVEVLDM